MEMIRTVENFIKAMENIKPLFESAKENEIKVDHIKTIYFAGGAGSQTIRINPYKKELFDKKHLREDEISLNEEISF